MCFIQRFFFAFCALLCLFSTNAFSNELAKSGNSEVAQSQNQSRSKSTYSDFLGCLNQLHPPIASGLNMRFRDTEILEEDRNFFYGTVKGKGGIILVTPSAATFDEVPLHKPPPGKGMPEYPLTYKNQKGEEWIWHYYVDKNTQRGDAAGGGAGKSIKENNRDTPFFPIGSPSSKISERDAIEAIAKETVPRIESMPDSIASSKKFDQQKFGKSTYDYDTKAKDALCSCMKTENTTIKSKAKEAAQKLNFGEMKECGEIPLVRLFPWSGFFISIANAAEQAGQYKNSGNISIRLEKTPKDFRIINNKISVCTTAGLINFSLPDGQIIDRQTTCDFNIKADSVCENAKSLRSSARGKIKDCATYGNQVGVATSSGIFILNPKQKTTIELDGNGGQRVAMSSHWIAWIHDDQIFARNISN